MKKIVVLMMMGLLLVGCGNTEAIDTKTDEQVTVVENETTEVITPDTSEDFEEFIETDETTEIETESVEEIEYTYTDLDKTMYAKQSVNVRDLPCADGNKLGGLSFAKEVHVTGQCKETSWYRIEFDGAIAYVSNNYLVDEKPVEQVASQPTVSISVSSGVPGDTNGDGVVDSEEESYYISPQEQIVIDAGYGNVVQIDATTYAVLSPDGYLNGIPAIRYLREYLQSIGIGSNHMVGCWIDGSRGYHQCVATDCFLISQ